MKIVRHAAKNVEVGDVLVFGGRDYRVDRIVDYREDGGKHELVDAFTDRGLSTEGWRVAYCTPPFEVTLIAGDDVAIRPRPVSS